MKLLTFELKKIIYSKKFLFLMIAIIGAIVFLFLRNISLQSYIKNEEQEYIESHLKIVYSNSLGHRNKLEIDPDNELELILMEINNEMKEPLFEQRNASAENDWKKRLNAENTFLTLISKYNGAGGTYPLSEREIEQTLAMNTKLIEENIAPEHEKYSIAFPNFMMQVTDTYINLGAIILMLILISEIVTSEFEQHSIKLLLTQPKRRGSILFSKWLVTLILYVITTAITLLITVAIGLTIGNKGTFDYPILFEKKSGISFYSISGYILESLTLQTVIVGMIISFYLFISLLIRNTLMAMIVLVVTLTAGYVLTQSIYLPGLAWYNPFRNLLPQDVLIQQNDYLWYEGIPVMLLLAIIFYIFSHKIIKVLKTR